MSTSILRPGFRALALCAPLFLLFLTACADPAPTGEEDSASSASGLEGSWRAVLASPGGELPFTLRIQRGPEGELRAVAVNGEERAPFSAVEVDGDRVRLDFTWYDSAIDAQRVDADELVGRWRKVAPEGHSELAFTARRDREGRFLPRAEAGLEGGAQAVAEVGGDWEVVFRDEDGEEPARGELRQQGDRVTGTFLTPVGDYRFLEGRFEDGLLRLSTFDGAHAFLFHARARQDGSLEGDFWSRDSYHATWTARRAGGGESALPDAWSLVGLTNDEGRFDFAFPDADGSVLQASDPRFAGKVLLVNIFGTWCPNCNDEAPLLAEWQRRYREQGLEVVGLAYEFTGDPERDREMVRRFADRHGIDYPLLLAGVSDKAAASETLPDLTRVLAYPTSVFLGRDGKVRRIHSGFAGPGTGEHHDRLVAELEGLLEELLAEPAPQA